MKILRWKALLAVFKIKRHVHAWFGTRRLDYKEKDLCIYTDTLREYETRARSVAKEPKTVEWIEKYGAKDSVLYDIGANIGAYSLIAAARGTQVLAFEPAPQNIYKLHQNVLLNNLSENITVVPLVLTKNNGSIHSFVTNKTFGASHSFSSQEEGNATVAHQTFLAVRLDECIETFSLPVPTMMKIDVDGAEMEVLQGAETLLKNPILRTILIEVDNEQEQVLRFLKDQAGFRVTEQEVSGENTTNYVLKR